MFKYLGLLTLAVFLLSACEKDEDNESQSNVVASSVYQKLSEQNYPDPIVSYVSTNYSNNTISAMYMKQYTDDRTTYDVELNDYRELYFDGNNNYIGMNDNSINVNVADLPSSISDYITNNYPDNNIVKAEKEIEDGAQVYEITLNNGYELYFSLDGTFLKLEIDSSYVNVDDLPQSILDYITNNYPEANILVVEKDTDDGETEYEVYLDNGTELKFNGNGDLTSIDNHVPMSDLPQSIIDYVYANYPDNYIDEAEIEFEDGQQVYKIELDNDIELYFDLEGNFLWMEED